MMKPPLFPFTFDSPTNYLQFKSPNGDDDYWQMDMLTDFFTEHLRMKVTSAAPPGVRRLRTPALCCFCVCACV